MDWIEEDTSYGESALPAIVQEMDWITLSILQEWGESDRVPITGLVPVTMSEVGVAESWGINGHREVVLVGEALQWWLHAEWEVPQTEWASPSDRVVGLQSKDSGTTNRQVTKAQQACPETLHTQSHRWAQSPLSTPVLYS